MRSAEITEVSVGCESQQCVCSMSFIASTGLHQWRVLAISLSDMLGHVLSAVTDIVLHVEDYRGISATRLILNMSVCEKFLSGVEPFQPES